MTIDKIRAKQIPHDPVEFQQTKERYRLQKEIHCHCGKLLAKQREDGKIVVWCKSCRKEVVLEVEPYEPNQTKTEQVF